MILSVKNTSMYFTDQNSTFCGFYIFEVVTYPNDSNKKIIYDINVFVT